MKNILLVVDMQKGFARCEETIEAGKRIEELLKKNIFDAVIATKFLNAPNSSYEKVFGWDQLETEEDQAFYGSIKDYVSYTVPKNIYNCVNIDFVQKLCQVNDGVFPEKIFVVGVDTECCVHTSIHRSTEFA